MYPYSAIIPTSASDNRKYDHNYMLADKIIETVRVFYNLQRGYQCSKSHDTVSVSAKQACRYFLTTLAGMGPVEIGRMTNFDHSTIIVSLQSVYGFIKHGDRLADDLKRIEAMI
ncbi:MAG: hypothetical protein JNK14_11450 [Chitinophagaceae bacterium]|nr:hypothetical protein [Chitinophagaceae bacterium]